MASEITLNDEASQSFALSHHSPHYCEAVIPFYATLSRRITEVWVFWSQECLETAHICLPVKTLIFNEPAKVTPRTLMCCHPQQPGRSVNQSRAAQMLCLLLFASVTRKYNKVILLFIVYTEIALEWAWLVQLHLRSILPRFTLMSAICLMATECLLF